MMLYMMERKFSEIKWILLIVVILPSGCYYDNVTDLYPNGCRVVEMSYTENINPILKTNCLSCHDEFSQQGGIILEGYENLIPYVENGKLMGSMRHEDGFVTMPLTGGKLSNCQIKKFESWIVDGALNN